MPTAAKSDRPVALSESLTLAEAIAAYPYSRRTLERWIATGRLSVIQPQPHARRYLLRAELDALLQPVRRAQ